MIDRFRQLKKELKNNEFVDKIMIDEEFKPSGVGGASFAPYDAVLCVTPNRSLAFKSNSEKGLDENELTALLENVEYDRIVGTELNKTSEPGEYLVFVSLESFERYKSRW